VSEKEELRFKHISKSVQVPEGLEKWTSETDQEVEEVGKRDTRMSTH
jgi:hypothetical protein